MLRFVEPNLLVESVIMQLIDIWHWCSHANMAFIYGTDCGCPFALLSEVLLTVHRSCRALPFILISRLFFVNGWIDHERAMTMAECRSVRSERHCTDRWAHSTGFPPVRFLTFFTGEVTPDEWKLCPPCADGQKLSFNGQVLFL